MPTTLASTPELQQYSGEELAFQTNKLKGRVLANMRFIGNLFLRQLLTSKIISSIVQELMMCDSASAVPEEHVVECVVELLGSIGYTLESMPAGKAALVQVCGRLKDLKQKKNKEGKAVYTKRIQFLIQDLLDARAAGWAMKVFKKTAKTKEEVRQEQERDLRSAEAGREVSHAEIIVAGQRPSYLGANQDAAAPQVAGGDWQEAAKSKKGRR
mmetsp:Transcript_83852/g.260744  ORF Transcript_83852/g.260744 Transcript_83852/m.260744 type:complete len:213 (-) Transcript_83852:86-724(-)